MFLGLHAYMAFTSILRDPLIFIMLGDFLVAVLMETLGVFFVLISLEVFQFFCSEDNSPQCNTSAKWMFERFETLFVNN